MTEITVGWPTLAELKQLRDVTGSEWDGTDGSRFTSDLESAIAQVKLDVGDWDESTDLPDASLNRAALRMAVLLQENAATPPDALTSDPIYQRHLKGHRRRFSIA
jgi:hypothetical protein